MTEKQQKVLSISSLIVFLLFCALVSWYIGVPMVRLAENPEQFRQWVDSYGVWSRVVFIGMVILQVIIAMIPGEAIELAAGYAFGVLEGTLLSMIGIVLGSWIIFWLVRKLGIKLVEAFFSKEQINQVSFLKDNRKNRVLAFLLMLIPGTPKDFLSYFAGLTGLNIRQWLLIVLIARAPSVITSTVTGAAAGKKQYLLAGVMLVATGIITLCGIGYYRYLCHKENEDENIDQAA